MRLRDARARAKPFPRGRTERETAEAALMGLFDVRGRRRMAAKRHRALDRATAREDSIRHFLTADQAERTGGARGGAWRVCGATGGAVLSATG